MALPPLQTPPGAGRRLRGWLVAIPIAALLFAALLAFNALQTASVLLIPVSRKAFRAFNRWAADTWWGFCVSAGEIAHGARVVVTGDPLPYRENAIVVANHQQMTDVVLLFALARSAGALGDLKWFVKDPIKYMPGVGWGMWFLDCLFVKRDWARDRAAVERTFERLVRGRVPLWLVSFSEGTRLTPEKLERARAHARSQGMAPPENVMVPRTKGFVASVQGLRGHARAVYDVTIGYLGGVPTLWQYVQGYAPVSHLHVRRTPLADLPDPDPDNGAALAGWLIARFADMDRRLDAFYRAGRFDEDAAPARAAV